MRLFTQNEINNTLFGLPKLSSLAVRDLLWSCFGPNLIDQFNSNSDAITCCHLALTPERIQWFESLDQQPEPLLTYLSQLKSRRLGHYFEALWQFFIINDPLLTLIAHNLPVQHQQRTLGEFDIIYHDNSVQQTYHLELAVKFYLSSAKIQPPSSAATLNHWLGPNCVDRLDKKLQRLLQHQIRLSEQTPARELLRSLGVHNVQTEIALKGILFQSASLCSATQQEQHPIFSTHHQQGYWYTLSSFSKRQTDHVLWRVLPKERWLSPHVATVINNNTLLNFESLTTLLRKHFDENQLTKHRQPLMLCAVDTSHGGEIETERCFVTGDQWPLDQHQ